MVFNPLGQQREHIPERAKVGSAELGVQCPGLMLGPGLVQKNRGQIGSRLSRANSEGLMAPEEGRGPGSGSVKRKVEGRQVGRSRGNQQAPGGQKARGQDLEATGARGAGSSGCWACGLIRGKGERQPVPIVRSYEAHCPS